MWIVTLRQSIFFACALLSAPLPLAAQPAPQAAPAKNAPAKNAPANAAPEITTNTTGVQEENISAHAALETHGATTSDDGYAKIGEAIARLRAAAQKAGLKESGRPLAVFSDAADSDFQFDAMLPVDAPADARPALGPDISLAQTPSGKALRFEHRGPYDDIDSTYDAITAYLDAKGLDARNLYAEEFLNDAKDSSDMKLQVDIHVFMK
ncbi:GyrI-like domain-containing protein [Rhodoblastus sp.]|uniref:GyrI-like domain-containing protein n=1 Tax=Rhodoblastus sp. TaxID=1962975 RepID=UPI003FD8130C